MTVYYRQPRPLMLPTFLLGMLAGWAFSAALRIVPRARTRSASPPSVAQRKRVSGQHMLRATLGTMRSDISVFAFGGEDHGAVVHQQFLTASGALNAATFEAAKRQQAERERDYSGLIMALATKTAELAEDVFNKVLNMSEVASAIAELSQRTKDLKAAADEMPAATDALKQGTKVVDAATRVADFANGSG